MSAKPFRKITSLVKLRSRQETPYQSWEDDQPDLADLPPSPPGANQPVVEFPVLSASPTDPVGGDRVLGPVVVQQESSLIECFYLGSTDMSGLEIKGRGCINYPAGLIWEQSQQDRKPKRKNSWHQQARTATSCFKLRYVKLVTGPDALQVHDNTTSELITQFNFSKISFVGTHPKYPRLFAFVAESPTSATPFCHAFKCEDKECAKEAACALSEVFNKKIQELLRSKKIQVTAQSTLLPN